MKLPNLLSSALRGPIVRVHPLTGEIIEPLGEVNGKVVWPIMGGAPDDDDDDDNDDDNDDTDDGDDDDDDADDKKGKKSSTDNVSRDEYDKLLKKLAASDSNNSKLQSRLDKIDQSKLSDLEKANTKVTELENEVGSLKQKLGEAELNNAFLASNKHSWHDSDTALTVARGKGFLEDVVGEDGTIDKPALVKALDKLSVEHPYLLGESKKKDDDDKDDDDKRDRSSGKPGGGRSKNRKDKDAREKALKSRFSSLR